MENSKKSFVFVLKRGSQSHVTLKITKPALVLDETCIKEFDFGMSLMGKAKDVSAIPNLPCIISKEGFQNVKLSYLGGMWVLFEFDSLASKKKFLNHLCIGSWFTELIQATRSFENDERIVWISIEGLPIKAWTPNTFRKIASLWGKYVEWEEADLKSLSCKYLCLKTNMKVIVNERQKVIFQGKVYWIRVKELDAWFPNFQEDDQDDLSFDEESQEDDVANKADNNESDVDRVSESSFMHENDTAHKDVNSCKKKESDDPKFPSGFTPDNNDQEKNVEENIKATTERVQSLSNKLNDSCSNHGFSSQRSMNTHSQKSKVGGSILDLMDELVTVSQTMGYNMTGLGNKAKRRWIKELCQKHRINFASIQETKAENISLNTIKDLWENHMLDHVVGSSVGCSGELNERRDLWDYLRTFIDRWEGDTVIMGDFNEVRSEHERFGSTFNRQGAIAFNNFISSACLIDLTLEGYAFTWAHKSASKMSKLDRYLILEGVLDLFPHLYALCLDRHLSDHRHILLRETNYDYGPSSFWFFHSWFFMEGFNSFVETTCKSLNIVEPNGLIQLKKKLQALKIAIKAWSKEANKRNAMEISQKAKIRWSIEGDENSKYFHGVMNKKRSQLKIHGTLANGEWISDPHIVKNKFFTHFKKQFLPIQAPSICFDFTFPTRLSPDQVQDLERTVTYEEVKRAVWDCGTNKSPGPDGFSFEFYRLKINLHKSKLMGIGVSSNIVAAAASLIGCSILTSPYNYLGVKVGSNMLRFTSWDDVISKVSSRLSKWKLKLLSIGGRLSLLKSVLISIPLYNMFIFKVPICVLNHLESIRQNLFYGVDGSDRKLAWIGWNMVLTSKKNGGEVALKVLYKMLYALEMCKSISVAEKMGHPSLSHSFRRMPRGGVEQKNYGLLCSKVADLVLPNILDRWCWSLEGSKEFSVKSSRVLIDNTILPKAEVPTRWLRVVPIKEYTKSSSEATSKSDFN
nr:RNA-directed DNA polymerase, eukaryota [Tanacetum cinerariifolium]